MKSCTTCGAIKSPEEFQIRRASADGLTASCKTCLSVRDKARANLQHRIDARSEYKKTDGGRLAVARAHKGYKLRNPERRAAQIAVGNAVRDGRLTPWPACSNPEGCESEQVVAHHPDYSRPLDVVWLCHAHHQQAHAMFKNLI